MKTASLFQSVLSLSLCLLALPVLSQTNEEMPSPCLVSSLNLSTGYNPQTTSYYTTGDTDPYWKVTYISPGLYADASGLVTIGSGAQLVSPHPMWSQNSQCRYLSALTNSSFTTQPARIYRTHLERTFQVCKTDTFSLQFNYAADDTLAIYLDGVYQFQTAAAHTSNSGQITLPLSAGTHTVKGILANGDFGNPGYYGARVAATVTSATGRNTMISESSPCSDYVCKPAGITDMNSSKEFAFRVVPNPVSGTPVKLYFSVPTNLTSGQVRVMALDGRTLFETAVTEGRGMIEVPVGDWPKGVYLAMFSFNGNRQTIQLLVR